MRLISFAASLLVLLGCPLSFPLPARSEEAMLKLHQRSQQKTANGENATVEKEVAWDPQRTAIIVIDMWDDHWCRSAAARVVEIAPQMNEVIKAGRDQGMFVIHAPSTCTEFYQDTPQRRRAQQAKFAATPHPLTAKERWGTKWNYLDPAREGELPIDDSDMGCDCREKCEIRAPWKRQIDLIEIAPEDAITDNGQETWNLLAERKIDNVIIMGVHLNMCVLGRPFAIRQMVYHGKNVVLMRDMTDTMYDPRMPPKVSHFQGTDLVVNHVEKHWCPTILSTDLTGKSAFVFKGDRRKR
jgi:nicotinamidase-related amidase